MMKKILCVVLFVIGTCLTSLAGTKISVSLNNDDHKSDTYVYGNVCNINVSLSGIYDDEKAKVSIAIENTNKTNFLLLFDKPYDEKSLKAFSPSTKYDKKSFPGTKGIRKTDYYSGLDGPKKIYYSEKLCVDVTCADKESVFVRLPFYLAKEKKILFWTKMSMWQEEVIELEIHVNLKPDSDYVRILDAYNKLVKDIDTETFCKNKNHPGTSYTRLKKLYEERINDLKRAIRSVRDSRGYYENDYAYRKFKAIYDSLGNISIEDKAVESCPKDKSHHCKYCKLTYEEVFRKLENYYVDLRNGDVQKTQIMPDVETIYTCFKKNSKRKGDGNLKDRITKQYNLIKSY